MLRQALKPSPNLTKAIGATWAFRAHGEREAVDRFRRLAERLREFEADAQVVELALKAAEDERRHADLCVRLAAAYGTRANVADVHAIPVGAPGLDAAERTLAEVVSLCCVAETLSVAALGEIRRLTVAEDIRSVVHQILRDEVSHARLGWAYLGAERERGRGGFLEEFLPTMMVAGIPENLFEVETGAEDEEALAFGQLSRARRVQIFEHTFRAVIFPGFDMLGVSTKLARAKFAELVSNRLALPNL